MNNALLALGVIGAGVAAFTVVDHENLLGNNPTKAWWWTRILPVQTAKASPIPFPFRQFPQQSRPFGVIIAPSAIVAVGKDGVFNGQENARIGANPAQPMQAFVSGKYS